MLTMLRWRSCVYLSIHLDPVKPKYSCLIVVLDKEIITAIRESKKNQEQLKSIFFPFWGKKAKGTSAVLPGLICSRVNYWAEPNISTMD